MGGKVLRGGLFFNFIENFEFNRGKKNFGGFFLFGEIKRPQRGFGKGLQSWEINGFKAVWGGAFRVGGLLLGFKKNKTKTKKKEKSILFGGLFFFSLKSKTFFPQKKLLADLSPTLILK